MSIFSEVRRIVRANSRSMIIVTILFFVLLLGCFMPAVGIIPTSPFSSPAYGLNIAAQEQPTSAEKLAFSGAVVAVLGGILALLNSLLTYLRTVRERTSQVMPDTLPVTQLSLGLSPSEIDQENTEQRQNQRILQAWKWFFTGLFFLFFPLQFLITVLPSFFGDLGFLEVINFIVDKDPTNGALTGLLISLAVAAVPLLLFYLWPWFRAWHRVRATPLDEPSTWRREVVLEVDPAQSNVYLLNVCAKALRMMGGKLTEIEFDQGCVEGKVGKPRSGYDDITVHIEREGTTRCSLTLASDGVRPTFAEDEHRHFSNLRRFTEVLIG